MSFPTALFWTEKLLAFSVILQTFEILQIRWSFSSRGIWPWSILQKDFPDGASRILAVFLRDDRFLWVLQFRLLAAMALLLSSHPVWITILLATTLLTSWRWRGAFNGGSDAMTFVVLIGLMASFWTPGGLWYIGLQLTLSYFFAGLVKVKNPDWRNGQALRQILQWRRFEVGFWALPLSIFILLFECSFPLVFWWPEWTLAYLAFALLFHFTNVILFGLNRFFWIWLTAYPSLLFCISHLP